MLKSVSEDSSSSCDFDFTQNPEISILDISALTQPKSPTVLPEKLDETNLSDSLHSNEFEWGENASNSSGQSNSRTSSKDRSNPKYILQVDVYIQMTLYQENTLSHWISNRKTIDETENLNIFMQLVQALDYIHVQGLIHRDLKVYYFSGD